MAKKKQPIVQNNRLLSLKERYTKQEVEDAIVKCNGRWAAIAAALNCSYNQLSVWMENHKDHFKLAEKLRMQLVDQAEEQVSQLLNSPDADVRKDIAKFILKTLGKSRGWTENPNFVQNINAGDNALEIKNIFGI